MGLACAAALASTTTACMSILTARVTSSTCKSCNTEPASSAAAKAEYNTRLFRLGVVSPLTNPALLNAPRPSSGPPPGRAIRPANRRRTLQPDAATRRLYKFRLSTLVVLVKQPRALPDCALLHHPEPVGQGGRVRPGTRPVRIPQRQKERYA